MSNQPASASAHRRARDAALLAAAAICSWLLAKVVMTRGPLDARGQRQAWTAAAINLGLYVAIVIAISALVYGLYEEPANRWLRNRLRRPAKP